MTREPKVAVRWEKPHSENAAPCIEDICPVCRPGKTMAYIGDLRAENDRLRKALEDALEIIRSVNDPTQASAGLRQIVEAALRPDGEVGG